MTWVMSNTELTGEISRGIRVVDARATSGDTSKQNEESNDGRLYGHSAPGFELEWAVPNDA